jgi:hypothetical protein
MTHVIVSINVFGGIIRLISSINETPKHNINVSKLSAVGEIGLLLI